MQGPQDWYKDLMSLMRLLVGHSLSKVGEVPEDLNYLDRWGMKQVHEA